jgi:hypothetical protein
MASEDSDQIRPGFLAVYSRSRSRFGLVAMLANKPEREATFSVYETNNPA